MLKRPPRSRLNPYRTCQIPLRPILSQNVILFEFSVYFCPLINIRLLGYRCSTFEPVAAVSPLMPLARENCEASHVFRQDRLLCWLISECHILGYGEFEMNMQHCLKTHETDMSEFDQSSKTQILNIPKIHPFRAQIGSRTFSRMVSKHNQRPMLKRVACPHRFRTEPIRRTQMSLFVLFLSKTPAGINLR